MLDPIKMNEYMRKRTAKRKAEGKCISCGKPSDNGRAICTACSQRRKEKRAFNIANGMCAICGMPVLGKNTLCETHRIKNKIYHNKPTHKEPLILDGKKASADILAELQAEAYSLKKAPTLKIITVGNDAASEVYVRNKMRVCAKVGIDVDHITYPENVDKKELYYKVLDNESDGVLVQFPAPAELELTALNALDNLVTPLWDVDGLGMSNRSNWGNSKEGQKPCTALGIMKLLEYYNISLDGKNVVIINRSDLVGKPLAAMMTEANATVTLCHSHTENLRKHTIHADIVVVAVGKPNFLSADMINKHSVVIDVGINRTENGIVGDCSEDIKHKAAAYTPVPGGVGVMTTAMVAYNVIKSAKELR